MEAEEEHNKSLESISVIRRVSSKLTSNIAINATLYSLHNNAAMSQVYTGT